MRRRVDWQREINKTERIRRRGLAMSAFAFSAAVAVIMSSGYLNGTSFIYGRKVLVSACAVVGLLLLCFVLYRRKRKLLLKK